ncbi:hypothetical protein NXF25_007017 [Crotalus adamanteus]|uniref:Uncharacterized protein n=1 Tax=Crotalus adamanteus TaxID=8729 RepID=A0AAW1C3F9_CROAD
MTTIRQVLFITSLMEATRHLLLREAQMQ